jgi:hypothetical protein
MAPERVIRNETAIVLKQREDFARILPQAALWIEFHKAFRHGHIGFRPVRHCLADS